MPEFFILIFYLFGIISENVLKLFNEKFSVFTLLDNIFQISKTNLTSIKTMRTCKSNIGCSYIYLKQFIQIKC